MGSKPYVLCCRWCSATFAIRGRHGHSAAFTKLKSHIYYAHDDGSKVMDRAMDYSNEGYQDDSLQEVREQRLIREGIRPIATPDDAL